MRKIAEKKLAERTEHLQLKEEQAINQKVASLNYDVKVNLRAATKVAMPLPPVI